MSSWLDILNANRDFVGWYPMSNINNFCVVWGKCCFSLYFDIIHYYIVIIHYAYYTLCCYITMTGWSLTLITATIILYIGAVSNVYRWERTVMRGIVFCVQGAIAIVFCDWGGGYSVLLAGG